MPVKPRHTAQKHPKHYAKVYWPYLPLVIIMGAALWLAYPSVSRSQRGVLSYATNVNISGLLESTNNERQTNNQSQLAISPKLNQAAQAKAEDMVARNYWSHDTPEGQKPTIFADVVGYGFDSVAENLAYGFNDSSQAVKGWLNSPSHRGNLLNGNYTEVGFGIAESPNYLGKGPETVVVAMYGKPANGERQVLSEVQSAESSKSISKAQTLTGGKMPWITLLVGFVAGAGLVYLVIKHSVAIHRAIRKGEKFILKHPVWDVTILALIILCVLLSQSTGVIR